MLAHETEIYISYIFIKARQQIKVLEMNVINITPINKVIDSQTNKAILLSHINSFNCNLIKVYLLLLLLLLISQTFKVQII